MPDQFEGKSDHDLLVVAVTELGHIKGHLAALDEKVGVQNGRISALEKWRWTMSGVIALIGMGWPLLIYEFRQFILNKFDFIAGG